MNVLPEQIVHRVKDMIKELYISKLIKIKPLANQSMMLSEAFGDCALLPDFDPGNNSTINLINFLICKLLDVRHTLQNIMKELYTIHTIRDHIGENGALRQSAIDLQVNGGDSTYDFTHAYQYVEPAFITAELEAAVEALPDCRLFKYKLEPADILKGQYIKVSDLSQEVSVELPQSSVEDEEGVSRQLTYQEVEDRPTVSTSVRSDGNYYFSATAHCGFRPLTTEEYLSLTIPLIFRDDLPDFPES
jgi:hypothetical protein